MGYRGITKEKKIEKSGKWTTEGQTKENKIKESEKKVKLKDRRLIIFSQHSSSISLVV